ncbi:hypothetical protein ACFFLM_21265 [Deinococcus oregonensis]|uniref:Uncharacterized protein n=1 Tax=Deinococcus oregonensis TaxID=1805970 RepID=A0ABV6B6F8_9DEIO
MYQVISTPRRMALTAALMLAASALPVAGLDSDVAVFRVPDGSIITLLHDQPMRMFLQARFEQGRVAGAAGSLVTVTVNVNQDGRQLIRTTRADRALPSLNHPDVIAYTQIANGAWTPARVLSINWGTGAVGVETPSNAGKVRVYYTFGDGEIVLRAGRPFGGSSGAIQIYRTSARGLHETDQVDRDTAPYAVRSPQPIPQMFNFSIAVRAASAVYFDGLARHEVNIAATETAVNVTDATMLAELAERQLKGV